MPKAELYKISVTDGKVMLRIPEQLVGAETADMDDIQAELHMMDVDYVPEELLDIYNRTSGEFDFLTDVKSTEFTLQIEQAQAATRQQSEAAASSLAQGERAAGAARAASNLAIHRSQLQSAIARQSGQSAVGQKKRTAKRATPQHMRTKLSIDSGLGGGGGSGSGASGLGGNVG